MEDEFENDGNDAGNDGGGGSSDSGSNSGSDNSSQNTSSQDFSIPEEYSDKGWAKFFDGKSGDDLKSEVFKSLDNSQSLVGKKTSEYLTSVDIRQLENFEDIKKALLPQIAPEMQVPEKAEDYSLNDILKDADGNQAFEYPSEVIDHFSNNFKELGINKEQGQSLLKMYTDFEMQQFNQLTDATALDKSLDSMFKNNSDNKNKCSSLIKEFLSPDSQKYLQDTQPNKTIEIFYELAKGMANKYDYNETGSPGQKGSNIKMSQAEKDQAYDKVYNELQDLNNRPHTDEEKQAKLKELRGIFV
ncbi:MAG: hypothetical protein WCG95_00085 [bacterium]